MKTKPFNKESYILSRAFGLSLAASVGLLSAQSAQAFPLGDALARWMVSTQATLQADGTAAPTTGSRPAPAAAGASVRASGSDAAAQSTETKAAVGPCNGMDCAAPASDAAPKHAQRADQGQGANHGKANGHQ